MNSVSTMGSFGPHVEKNIYNKHRYHKYNVIYHNIHHYNKIHEPPINFSWEDSL